MTQDAKRSQNAAFRTRLLASSWFIPIFVGFIGFGLSVNVGTWPWSLGIGGFGVLLAVARVQSYTTIAGELLVSRFFGVTQRVNLRGVTTVRTRPSKASLLIAPALDFADDDGRRLSLRLGWWRRERTLLQLIRDTLPDTAHLDTDARAILKTRPSGESWALDYRGDAPEWAAKRRPRDN